MANYRKYTDRMDIYIEEGRKKIVIRQQWRYEWLVSNGATKWTGNEKLSFHKKIDSLIWATWGEKFYLGAKGISGFAKQHKNTRWDVNFDVEWVAYGEHWKVKITKYPKGTTWVGSSVKWNQREIKLDNLDTSLYKRTREGTSYLQYPVVHEFGHAVGNSILGSGHGDEYKQSSIYYSDKNSLMNVGQELRERHLDFVLSELNNMIPQTRFFIV